MARIIEAKKSPDRLVEKPRRDAAGREPDNAVIVGNLAKGLRQTGKGDEARGVPRAALFRNARSPRFRRL